MDRLSAGFKRLAYSRRLADAQAVGLGPPLRLSRVGTRGGGLHTRRLPVSPGLLLRLKRVKARPGLDPVLASWCTLT